MRGFVDVTTKELVTTELIKASTFYNFVIVTNCDIYVKHSTFSYGVALGLSLEIYDKIEAIVTSRKEALLELQNERDIIKKIAAIKINDFPNNDIKIIQFDCDKFPAAESRFENAIKNKVIKKHPKIRFKI